MIIIYQYLHQHQPSSATYSQTSCSWCTPIRYAGLKSQHMHVLARIGNRKMSWGAFMMVLHIPQHMDISGQRESKSCWDPKACSKTITNWWFSSKQEQRPIVSASLFKAYIYTMPMYRTCVNSVPNQKAIHYVLCDTFLLLLSTNVLPSTICPLHGISTLLYSFFLYVIKKLHGFEILHSRSPIYLALILI